MPDRPSESRRRVTLEDLLRLKRAERPQPEFWAGFESELRQRQLAALVEKQSWWREALSLARLRTIRLPLGATAVLALALLAIHRQSPSPVVATRAVEAPRAGPAGATAAVMPPARAETVAMASPDGVQAPAPRVAEPARKEEPGAPAAAVATAGQVPGIVPWLGDIALNRLAAAESPDLGRPAAVDLSSVSVMVEPAMAATAAPALSFEERALPETRRRPTADVLPTAAAAAAPRRARLLAVLDSIGGSILPEPSAPEHVRRSATRYLMQDGGDRSMGRLDAEAVGLSLVRF